MSVVIPGTAHVLKYELRGLKEHPAPEGIWWEATLYDDGMAVGTCMDKGDGGGAWVTWDATVDRSTIVKEFTDWHKANAGDHWTMEFIKPLVQDVEQAVNYIYEIACNNKKTLKNLLLRQGEEEFVIKGHTIKELRVLNYIIENRGGGVVWDRTQSCYRPVMDVMRELVSRET